MVWSKQSANFLKSKMSDKAAQEEQDFKVAMQQLSAEAEKILPMLPGENDSSAMAQEAVEQPQPTDAFTERVHSLENSVLSRLEQFAAEMETARGCICRPIQKNRRAAGFNSQHRKCEPEIIRLASRRAVEVSR